MSEQEIKWKITGTLTRERIEEHKKRLGMKMRPTGNYRSPNQWAHWDRISMFADKLGDPNRLWRDEDYAKTTRYGRLPAPPGYPLCTMEGMRIQGLPGVQVMVGGAAVEFYRPIGEGDRIDSETTFSELEERGSAFSALWLIEYYDQFCKNQKGELVTKIRSHMLRWERKEIAEGLQRSAKRRLGPHPWTQKQIREIEEEVLGELDNIRGAVPRYWEDVREGETLPDLVRGPYRYTDGMAAGSTISIWRSGATGVMETRRHPGYALQHPESGAYEKIELIHMNRFLAQQMHYAHAYDYGLFRQAVTMNALTDWMGDDGWLKKHTAQARRVVCASDVIRIKSTIARKYIDTDGEPCVDIEQHAMNQLDHDVMPTKATVALPSREKRNWPVADRVSK